MTWHRANRSTKHHTETMKPKSFPEANFTWKGYPTPEGQPQVGDLPAWRDERDTVSLWKMSFRERWSALFFGKVWIRTLIGKDHLHPMIAFVHRQPFEDTTTGQALANLSSKGRALVLSLSRALKIDVLLEWMAERFAKKNA